MNQGHEHGRGGGRGRGGGGRGGHDASVDKAHRMMGGGGGKLDGVIDVMYQDYLHGGKLLTSFSQWCDHNQHKENQPVASIMRLVFACFKGQLPPPARTATIHKIKQQFDKGQKIRQLQVPPNIVGHLAAGDANNAQLKSFLNAYLPHSVGVWYRESGLKGDHDMVRALQHAGLLQ